MAQLVARFVRIEEVRSSNLLSSTTNTARRRRRESIRCGSNFRTMHARVGKATLMVCQQFLQSFML